jgi:integrase
MPHYPKPFYREPLGRWYVQIEKKQFPLGHDPKPKRDKSGRPVPPREIVDRYHELMANHEAERARPVSPTVLKNPHVSAILDEFLEWASRHKAPRTFAWYRENIQKFLDSIPKGLLIADLKPFHLTKAMERFPHWANNTKHDFLSAVKRAFSWAADEELIERSPVARVKKPAREAREMSVSPAEYASVLEAIREPNFRDLIELSWETGSRPQELRKIQASYFDAESSRVVFPPKQAKGKKHYRIIYLTPRAREIVSRLVESRPEGTVLVNSEGNPWTKDAINCAFCRLAKKIGKKYHLGAFRKGFATEALKAGVDTVTVAHPMGHRDPSMVSKSYGQVQHDPEHMAEAARRAKGRRVKTGGDAGASGRANG